MKHHSNTVWRGAGSVKGLLVQLLELLALLKMLLRCGENPWLI